MRIPASATSGVATRRVPRRVFASATLQRCTERAQGDASRPRVSERLPPGPSATPRPRSFHAPRAPAARTRVRRARRPRRAAARPLPARRTHRWNIDMRGDVRGAARTARAHPPRSCALRHASVSCAGRVLRSPPSAESRSGSALSPRPAPHTTRCDGVNALRERLFALPPRSTSA